MQINHHAILEFWYGQWPFNQEAAKQKSKLWFASTEKTDQEIKHHFLDQIEAALNQVLSYTDSIDERLAFILLTDQFTRNVYRKTAKAFSGDELALEQCQFLINEGQHLKLPATVAAFACMPLQHSESAKVQKQSIKVFNDIAANAQPHERESADGYANYAQLHADIIFQFNRFPHRNEALNRSSSDQELSYLDASNIRFGQ